MSRAHPDPDWILERARGAASALRRAVSATNITFARPGFGWVVRPAPGSVLASPRGAHWDPEPDYFHHWVRDAAIAIRAVPDAIAVAPETAGFWQQAIAAHIRFSLAISDPARRGPDANPLRPATDTDYEKFLRPDADLQRLTGDAWLGEPRCAADGQPDLERWSRPQHDGPALRASSLIAVLDAMPELDSSEAGTLIERDLAYTAKMAGRASIGPWEEAPARRSTFTLIAQWDALVRAVRWAAKRGRPATDYRAATEHVAQLVQEAADPETGGWRESIEARPGHLDSATILALLHAARRTGPFAMTAPRTRATAAALEATFARIYPLNADRPVPAMGRWAEDVYFGGNPWYPVTLGFAELHYRIAELGGDLACFDKADAWMALVAEMAPDCDDLPEQFDRETGAPVSCPALTWSAAAFLGAVAARRRAVQAMGAR